MTQRNRFGLHETIERSEEIAGPSNRSFGFTVGGILCAIAVIGAVFGSMSTTLATVLSVIGVPLIVLAAVAPQTLTVPNSLWMKLGLLLALIVTPIVMGLVFLVAFVPFGLVMRLRGIDPLQRKIEPDAASYWTVREPAGPEPAAMANQF